ncbi:MAG: class I SAM-dependent methyltransferase [Chloroflexi bacterium]|nr:class I SAM-dependent methyltransferase [Chloroflexota bacterium]
MSGHLAIRGDHLFLHKTMNNHPDAIRWNGRYQTDGPQRQQAPPSQLLQDFAYLLPKTGVVLDAAAGVGINALFVAGLGVPVVALDISEMGLGLLRQRAIDLQVGVETAVFDLTHPYFPTNCVNAILNFRFLERATFAAYQQALRPGGLLIFETFVCAGGEETPDHFLQPGELRRAFTNFDVIFYAETTALSYRSGQIRQVAQLVARKP